MPGNYHGDTSLNLFFILSAPVLMGLIYLAVWAAQDQAKLQDEIEVEDDRAKALASFLRETSQT